MAAGIDDAGQPIPNEQRIMVPKFKFRPVDESTVMDLLRNLDIRTATRVVEEHQHQLAYQCLPNIIGIWEWGICGLMGGAFIT